MKLYKQILPQAGSELDTWNSFLHVNFAVSFTRSKKTKKVNTNIAFLRRYTTFMFQEGFAFLFFDGFDLISDGRGNRNEKKYKNLTHREIIANYSL